MLLLAKILVTFLTVVLLAKVAERMSPRHAGLLAGFPLGTAIALYFFGWQQGPQFAADSAVFTLSGLTSAICLAYGYWQVAKRKPGMQWLPLAVLSGFACFFAASLILQQLPANRWLSLAVVVAAIFLFRTLFKDIAEQQIDRSQPPANKLAELLSGKAATLLFRASIATASILLITGLADLLGPTLAGLLAAFPVSFFPLMLILHISYGAGVLNATIKHYPDGIGALVVYALAVSYLYPLLGLHWGTAASLLCSVGYLLVYSHLRNKSRA
ncbi:hypothetical protein [Thalassolituus hydrocarboniclasticus]|uniref:Uncharacterized protein n=1 Tax=Thalassolituus hydrocarboniclasticus TaxID=2742796 RepID=A0ABY6A6S2_9GAMM|nr:hypothetical protein [Thalassolituus hydrocarboniclasticus]UXD86702.1 hypothetical protein HUF19_04250 [Thalassolituus hydrocarboniclasticus]